MHPPCDSSLDISANPFVIEPSSQLSYPPGFAEPLVPSNLKPYLGVFRVNPFTSHDGVHGRSVPTSARIHTHPEDIRPIILEFQLSLGSSPESSPESESYSEEVPMSVLPPPDPDVTIKPGPLRYLDGDTAPLTEFAEPPQTELETTTWSTAPLYHPYPSRQSFPQLDGARTSSPTYYAHSRTNDPDHPFTRVDRTPEPEAASFRPVTLTYPPSLAYHTQQAGSRSESMYASESTSEVGQESSDGYRFEYSSSDGLGGYSITHAPTAGSHFYPQDNSYFQAQQPSFSFARSDVSSQHTLFATPAQMAIPSHQEGVYPSSDSDLSPSPYPSGNLDSTNDHSLDRPTPPSFQPQLPADHCYVHDSTQLRDSNRYDFLAAQSDARTREIKFSTSPHQAHLGPIRHPSLPNSYDSYSRESHFQITPRGYDQLASRGYRHDASGSEQPMSEPQHNSRSPSLLDRGTSFLLDRPVSRTDSSVFENPRPDAFSHTGARTLDPSSSPPYEFDRPGSDVLDRPSSREFSPFTRRSSLDLAHVSGTITPMRIFDSPVPTRSPTRSPTPSTTSPLVERPNTSRAARQFAPFPPGGMNRTEGGVKKHLCTVCNKKFPRPSTLKTHMNTHTGERPHLCPVKGCGHRFTVSSNLRRHIKTHKLPGATAHASRNKPTPAPKEQPGKQRPRVLQERKNFQIWCPESLRGMRNAKNLSSRPPFEMLEEVAPLPTPLHAVQPHGRPGDENYEDRDSFFYAYETDQPSPYHPLVWELHPTLPGPLPSQADCEARACGSHGFGDTLSGSGTWVRDNHRA